VRPSSPHADREDAEATLSVEPPRDRLRSRLDQGLPALGTFVQLAREPAEVIVLAQAGLDFVVVDLEHGTFDPPTVQRLCLAARLAGITPLVRTPGDFGFALDAGAVGVIAPHVDDRAAAARVVAASRFPPAGSRSASSFNAQGLYRLMPLAEAVETLDRETFVVVQVESRAAVENAAELATTPGVDALLVGPSDLTLDFGLDHEAAFEAIGTVIDAGREAQCPVGIHVSDADAARRWLERGARIVSVSTDTRILLEGARAIDALRG
jgi:2-keto-3-deoxy-L-rhamnonate aldolase RhmA